MPGGDKLIGAALDIVPGITTISAARKSPEFVKAIETILVKVNKDGSVVTNNSFAIQKFCILPQDFSSETGELTATQKLKRGHVQNQHEKFIDTMYADGAKGTYVDFDDANSALVVIDEAGNA